MDGCIASSRSRIAASKAVNPGGSGNNDHGSDSSGPEAGSDSAITPIVVTADPVSAAESLGLSIRALTCDFTEIENWSTVCGVRRDDGVQGLCSVVVVLCDTVDETAAAKGRVASVEERWL